MSKADFLVVDSVGFIKNAPLRDLGHNIITLPQVVDEIRDKATLQRLQVLPYELQIRRPSCAGMKVVTEFSKKTGDYAALSAVDIMVLAVTYDLEVEKCGKEHLKKEPQTKKTVDFYTPHKGIPKGDKKIAGFFSPDNEIDGKSDLNNHEKTVHGETEEDFSSFQFWREPIADIAVDLELSSIPADITNLDQQPCPLSDQELKRLDLFLEARSFLCDFTVSQVDKCVADLLDDITVQRYDNILRWFNQVTSYDNVIATKNVSLDTIFKKIADGFDFSIDEVLSNVESNKQLDPVSSDEGVGLNDSENDEDYDEYVGEDYGQEEEENSDDDDEGWITPSNIKMKKDLFPGKKDTVKQVKVACLTTDFAMQNVLKQIGLNILGTNGMLIKTTKTWILRCYACFHTTPLLDKKFCPKCGNQTLKRVSVTLNKDGTQRIHLSNRIQISARGKKFSLPKPVGGKHGVNPRLFDDQPEAQQRLSKKAMQQNNPLDGDWIAGTSPFLSKDVTSKSAMLGLRNHGRGNAQPTGKYWAQKNPNASRKSTGSKRKK